MKTIKKGILLLVLVIFASCASNYDPYSYNETVRLKEKTVKLVELGFEPYSVHAKSIDSLKVELNTLYSYEKTREKNEATVKLWSTVIVHDRGIIYGYFSLWKKKGSLNLVAVRQSIKDVTRVFDELLELENAKK